MDTTDIPGGASRSSAACSAEGGPVAGVGGSSSRTVVDTGDEGGVDMNAMGGRIISGSNACRSEHDLEPSGRCIQIFMVGMIQKRWERRAEAVEELSYFRKLGVDK